MIRIHTRKYIDKPLSSIVGIDMKTEVANMMQFGGDFGDVNERNYMFQKPEEVNVDANIHMPNRLELGCPSYCGSEERFARSLGIVIAPSVPPTTPPPAPTE